MISLHKIIHLWMISWHHHSLYLIFLDQRFYNFFVLRFFVHNKSFRTVVSANHIFLQKFRYRFRSCCFQSSLFYSFQEVISCQNNITFLFAWRHVNDIHFNLLSDSQDSDRMQSLFLSSWCLQLTFFTEFYICACIFLYLLSLISVDHLLICSLSFMMITFIMQFLQNITAFFLKIHHFSHRNSLVESFKQMFILNHEFQHFIFEFSKFFCWHFKRAW